MTFDTFLEAQAPFGAGACLIDLQGISFVSPTALVNIAAMCRALHADGTRPTLHVSDPDLRRYLVRAGLYKAIEPFAQFEPAVTPELAHRFDTRQRASASLVELTEIGDVNDLEELLPNVIDRLTYRLGYSESDALRVAVAISEMLQNGYEHDVSVYFAMQAYKGGGFVEIAAADSGPGIAATLARNTEIGRLPDREAILRAVQLGVSGSGETTRGTGLHHLLRIALAHRGGAQIRSGGAAVRWRMDRRQGWAWPVPSLPGVQLTLTLPGSS